MTNETGTEEPLERVYPVVRSKGNFVRRYISGEFGNGPPTWSDPESYKASGYSGLVHIRTKVPGGRTYYDIAPDGFDEAWNIARLHYNKPDLFISGMAPEDKKVFQGEVVRGSYGPRLYYNLQPLPMRKAFDIERKWAAGVKATEIIRHYFCPKSYDWLQILFDRYPGHVVEFSTYSVEWGSLPGYNTLFWEVRTY